MVTHNINQFRLLHISFHMAQMIEAFVHFCMLRTVTCRKHLIDHAKDVMKEMGLKPSVMPIRGGTDGARLSFMGLPCPNLGTGGHAFHGPYEHVTAEGMETAVKISLGILKKYVENVK